MKKMKRDEASEFFQGITLNFKEFNKGCFFYNGKKDGLDIKVIFGSSNVEKSTFDETKLFLNADKFKYFNPLESLVSGTVLYQFSEV